jgi:hypothetical protein
MYSFDLSLSLDNVTSQFYTIHSLATSTITFNTVFQILSLLKFYINFPSSSMLVTYQIG